jgi:hypothetical protein
MTANGTTSPFRHGSVNDGSPPDAVVRWRSDERLESTAFSHSLDPERPFAPDLSQFTDSAAAATGCEDLEICTEADSWRRVSARLVTAHDWRWLLS